MTESDKADSESFSAIIKFMASIMKSVGITGFIVLIVSIIFLFFSTKEQKEEFIDTWILLSPDETKWYPCAFIIVTLLLLIALQVHVYRIKLKSLKKENKRIGEEKSSLQKTLLDKKLNSSSSTD